jgi:hydroxymethylglutaryl-CoA reductase
MSEFILFFMKGVLEIPMPVGTKGGVIQSHPTLAYTHGTLSMEKKKHLFLTLSICQDLFYIYDFAC